MPSATILRRGDYLKKGDPSFENHVETGFTNQLVATRRSELQAFADALRNESVHATVTGENGDEAFELILGLAVNGYGASQKQIAEATYVNVATVSRWVAGTARAPRLSRPTILYAIASLIEHDVESAS